ncbi:Holliday junction branch migration protein RuvA [Psittacicella hinzii]|uniref:Holliday junction branch migration complex subunit RuvA n=1 Tax=Psittacicella hinzii TaxID=2028575 RepID=A0A3A1YLG0_9GAMM|nr:Holliday junction branch migration protein RuvA [Psittacicella hinzii]RIY37074.1 Holliday junction branch migration protein RuvA [Psittacicella hinzii]
MYGSIHGVLLDKSSSTILIDCQGIGFEITVPLTTFQRLPEVGKKVFLFVYHRVLEDAHQLYGFGHAIDKRIFMELIKLNKIGPKVAMSVLGMYDFNTLLSIINQKDVKALAAVPWIGKATAERMVVELNNRLDALMETVALGQQQMHMLNRAYKVIAQSQATSQQAAEPIVNPVADSSTREETSLNTGLLDSQELEVNMDPVRLTAAQALINLGLKEAAAQQIIDKVWQPNMALEVLIKACLEQYKDNANLVKK